MSFDGLPWANESELRDAAYHRLHNDALTHAVAYTAAMVAIPDGPNDSLTRTLREVAIQVAAIALLIDGAGTYV